MDTAPSARLLDTHPVFLVGNIAATIPWYERVLAFKADPFPPSPPHAFCVLTRDDVAIMLQQLDGYLKPNIYTQRQGGVWNAYIPTTGVRALYEAVSKRSDVRILQRLHQQPYGQLEFEMADPNGYVLVFAERT